MRRANERRRKRRAVSLVVLVTMVVGAILVGRSPLFSITDVRVDGVEAPQQKEVLEAARVDAGQNLFEADLAAARERVARLPWVADVSVEQIPPSAVVMHVAQRPAAAVIRTASASWLVERSGLLIAGGEREDIPVIQVPDATLPPVGQPVRSPEVLASLAVISEMPPGMAHRVVRFEPVGDQVTAIMNIDDLTNGQSSLAVRLGSPRDLARKFEVLPAMLDVIARPDQTISSTITLDVRAPEHPVVRGG